MNMNLQAGMHRIPTIELTSYPAVCYARAYRNRNSFNCTSTIVSTYGYLLSQLGTYNNVPDWLCICIQRSPEFPDTTVPPALHEPLWTLFCWTQIPGQIKKKEFPDTTVPPALHEPLWISFCWNSDPSLGQAESLYVWYPVLWSLGTCQNFNFRRWCVSVQE
jgi:hypothetical protein